MPVAVAWFMGALCERPDDPLDNRGWTLQEAFVSQCILYYDPKELIWKYEKVQFEPVIATYDLHRPDDYFRLLLGFYKPTFSNKRNILSHIS